MLRKSRICLYKGGVFLVSSTLVDMGAGVMSLVNVLMFLKVRI